MDNHGLRVFLFKEILFNMYYWFMNIPSPPHLGDRLNTNEIHRNINKWHQIDCGKDTYLQDEGTGQKAEHCFIQLQLGPSVSNFSPTYMSINDYKSATMTDFGVKISFSE